MVKKTYIIIISLCLVLCMSGCRSHKKNIRDNVAGIDGIEIKFDKKNKKTGDKIAEEALTWLGTPYKYGGSDKGKGTDCSGMVMVIYSEIADIKMPRNSAEQGDFCESLKESRVEAGDLVFFAIGNDKNRISHVGIMLDALRFVHASSSKGVIVSDINTPYYRRNLKKFGRVPR